MAAASATPPSPAPSSTAALPARLRDAFAVTVLGGLLALPFIGLRTAEDGGALVWRAPAGNGRCRWSLIGRGRRRGGWCRAPFLLSAALPLMTMSLSTAPAGAIVPGFGTMPWDCQ